ncbi:MAG: succinate--CoA ligase subunit beta, partial [Candidatus Marinimicrobia bacterium]|nr:succinate--CoA ligase subunit beta [Candidatus Neomarinimicrobiota bacterium]
MKIHEYQAKKIFANFGMPVQDGYVFENIEETEPTIRRVQKDFNTEDVVVKAQIHAGGRGKGGGVKYSPNFDIAIQNAKNILGMNLVTHQTGEKGQLVRKVYVTEAFDIAEEYYAAITLDRGKSMDVFMISSEGGVEIEKVAAETPEKIVKVWIDPLLGMKSFQARKLAYGLNLSGDAFKAAMKIFMQMYPAYQSIDATIVEVNPLILTTDG